MIKLSHKKAHLPLILIHGGAGPSSKEPDLDERRRSAIREVMKAAWPKISEGLSATGTVSFIVEQLESSPLFNAGYGAVLQSDGLARLSASLMDGRKQKFSGVQLATHIVHPSKLAYVLQDREESVLGPLGAQLLAREIGMPPANPVTVERARRWVAFLEGEAESFARHGTVGAVALDKNNTMAAATSTGGFSNNYPERVSDSATVAGNYASSHAAISCTGIGEQIVDDGLAVRLETRVRDGKSFIEASDLVYAEASNHARKYGWIGADSMGNWAMYCTTEVMYCAAFWDGGEEVVSG